MQRLIKFFTVAFIASFVTMSCLMLTSCQDDDITVPEDFVWEQHELVPFTNVSEIVNENHGPDSEVLKNFAPLAPLPEANVGDVTWENLGSNLLYGCASGLGSFLTTKALDAIWSSIFGEDNKEINMLNQVISQLNSMQSQLDQLTKMAEAIFEKLDEVELNALYASFRDIDTQLASLNNVNRFYLERLKAVKGNDEETKKLLKEWGEQPVCGTTAAFAVAQLSKAILDFRYCYDAKIVNYCMVYDLIIYNTHAWEREGYDIRDIFRAKSAAILSQSYYLTTAYYSLYGAKESIENISTAAQNMADYFKSCRVHRYLRMVYCQLKGHHYSFVDDALDQHGMNISFWYTAGEVSTQNGYDGMQYFISSQPDFVERYDIYTGDSHTDRYIYCKVTDKDVRNEYLFSQLPDSAIKALINYYKNNNLGNLTLLQIFERGGFQIDKTFKLPDAQVTFATSDTDMHAYQDSDDWSQYTDKWDMYRLYISGYYNASVPIDGSGKSLCGPLRKDYHITLEQGHMFSHNWGKSETVTREEDGKTVTRRYANSWFGNGCKIPGTNFIMMRPKSRK